MNKRSREKAHLSREAPLACVKSNWGLPKVVQYLAIHAPLYNSQELSVTIFVICSQVYFILQSTRKYSQLLASIKSYSQVQLASYSQVTRKLSQVTRKLLASYLKLLADDSQVSQVTHCDSQLMLPTLANARKSQDLRVDMHASVSQVHCRSLATVSQVSMA